MSVIAKFSADGLAGGTPVTLGSTAGTGDTPWTGATAGVFTIDASGTRSPRVKAQQGSTTAAQLIWQSAVVGTLTNYAMRSYFEFTAWPSTSGAIMSAYQGTTQQWRITISGTSGGAAGQVRLNNGTGTQLASSGSTLLATGTSYRIEAVSSGGVVTVSAFAGDSTTAYTSMSATVGSSINDVRYGNHSTTPTWATFYLDDIALSNTGALIGPAGTDTPPPATRTWTLWNGTAEVPLTESGVWNGTSVVPLAAP